MPNFQIILIAIAVSLSVGFGSGWQVHSWKTDSEQMTIAKAAGEVERAVASTLETKLAELKANQKVIEHEKTTIIERPIYRNVCLDDDGLRLINAAKGNTTKPVGAVP